MQSKRFMRMVMSARNQVENYVSIELNISFHKNSHILEISINKIVLFQVAQW